MVLWGSAGVVSAQTKGEVPKLPPLQPPPSDFQVGGSARLDGVNETAEGSPSSTSEQLGQQSVETITDDPNSPSVTPDGGGNAEKGSTGRIILIMVILLIIGGGIYLFKKYQKPVA